MHEVDALAVDLGGELGELVEPRSWARQSYPCASGRRARADGPAATPYSQPTSGSSSGQGPGPGGGAGRRGRAAGPRSRNGSSDALMPPSLPTKAATSCPLRRPGSVENDVLGSTRPLLIRKVVLERVGRCGGGADDQVRGDDLLAVADLGAVEAVDRAGHGQRGEPVRPGRRW